MGILKPPGWRKVETQGCAVALLSFFRQRRCYRSPFSGLDGFLHAECLWECVSGEDFCQGLGELAKGTAGQINPTQESLDLLKAFKGRSELILIFPAKICLQNQAGRHCPYGVGEMLGRREPADLEDELQGVGMSPRTYIRPYSEVLYGWALCYVWRLNRVGTGLFWAPGASGKVAKKARGTRQRVLVGQGYGRVNVEGRGSEIWCLRGINSAWSRCRETGL